MKAICFIPARGGSRGIPRKNTRPLAGKPLISHTIKTARNVFDTVVVSTEDASIAKISRESGATVPFVRPCELASDVSTLAEVLLHGVGELRRLGYDFEVVVVRDCTVPFIRSSDMKQALSLLCKTGCDSVCGVYRQHLNPYYNMMEPNEEGFLRFSKTPKRPIRARHEAPVVYQLNGLFVVRVSSFLEYGSFYMPKTLPHEIPLETGLMIDTMFEFQVAECMVERNLASL